MGHPPWEHYVSRLCFDEWALDPHAVLKLMADLEALVATGDVDEASVATVLRMAGVDRAEADAVAPEICAAVRPDGEQSASPSS